MLCSWELECREPQVSCTSQHRAMIPPSLSAWENGWSSVTEHATCSFSHAVYGWSCRRCSLAAIIQQLGALTGVLDLMILNVSAYGAGFTICFGWLRSFSCHMQILNVHISIPLSREMSPHQGALICITLKDMADFIGSYYHMSFE